MRKPETHTVIREHEAPAGKPGECFYCGSGIGSEHQPECVCRKRSVVLRVVVEYAVLVPESWTPEQIEFHRNESSWCASNFLAELGQINDGCPCPFHKTTYLREATEEDEEKQLGFIP